MATISHKLLAGTQVHEPKGADSATSNRVYVSNGAGSGSWSQVPKGALSPLANPFGAGIFHLRDEKVSGTDGGTFTSGAWRRRDLNVGTLNQIAGASLASNQITLPGGTYYVEGYIPGHSCGRHQSRLYDVTHSVICAWGTVTYATTVPENVSNYSFLFGQFTLGGSSTLEVQHYCETTKTGDGFGVAAGFPDNVEVFTDVRIWKVG